MLSVSLVLPSAYGMLDWSGLSQASLPVLSAPASCRVTWCLVLTPRMRMADVLLFNAFSCKCPAERDIDG
jgi:hypothetical protein